jgi:hypothetical protein
MEVSFSPRDTACSGTYVTPDEVPLLHCRDNETMIMSLATKNNVSMGYFSCSGGHSLPEKERSRTAMYLHHTKYQPLSAYIRLVYTYGRYMPVKKNTSMAWHPVLHEPSGER